MTRISTQTLPRQPTVSDPELQRWIDSITKYLQELNQKTADIVFNNSQVVEVADTGTADTEFAVQHNLSRIPQHAYISYSSIGGSLYNSTTAWTEHIVYLKFTGANANIKVVIS